MHEYEDSVSTALVFEPPIDPGLAPLDLSREPRAAGAFVSFDELTTTWFFQGTCDRQATDGTSNYVRESVLGKSGFSYR